jgi:hypothetical protein
MFPGETLKKPVSPLKKNDHPELDESELLQEDDIKKYQSIIGALQWLVSLAKFDMPALLCLCLVFVPPHALDI